MGLSMVSSLARLEELKLRSATSTTGLTLADDGLAPLAGLHRLRSLSLTTVVGLAASQLDHLVGLEHLESLELGDCAGWTSADDYAVLARLPQLRHLRLEQVGISCTHAHTLFLSAGVATPKVGEPGRGPDPPAIEDRNLLYPNNGWVVTHY